MIDRLKSFIDSYQLLRKTDKLGIAVSAGKDSVCAAHLFNQLGHEFIIVHCNFQLRAGDSKEDEIFVQDLAENLEHCHGFYAKSFETQKYAEEKGLSIQMAARRLRYEYFEELYSQGLFDKLVLAHHLDDELETFFLNLYRSSGLRGLKSIPVQRNYIIRPLMAFHLNDLNRYRVQHKIQFREDRSNNSEKYLRNRIRLQILPAFEGHMAEFPLRAINSIKILKEEHELLEYLLAEIGTKALNTSISSAVSEVDLTSIKTYPQSHVILYSILDKYGFSADQCKQILSGEHSGKTIYSLDFELLRDRNRLYIRKRPEEYDHSIIIDKEGEYQIGKYIMRLNRSKDSVLPSDPWTELVHLPPDIFPLELRYWKKGDIFQPLGMVGSKKLSDFFVDQKIDRFSKGQIPVLAKGSEIYLVAGHRISEKIKIHSDMEELYRVNFSEYFRFDRDF